MSHSGRKGSSELPWIKSNFPLNKKNSWKTIAPSKIKRDKHWPNPKEASVRDLDKIKIHFIKSASYAKKIIRLFRNTYGSWISFTSIFSPISNKRKDNYGNNLKNRCRFLLEIASEIRKIWPNGKILGARVTGSDWVKKGSTISDCIFV